MSQKSVALIHDISGFGRCSLTVALPIISAMGIKTSAIPTAVLSTHTGGFIDNTFCDLTSQINPIAKHWKKEGLKFDAVYTGYLCGERQVNAVISAVEALKSEGTAVIVDPAMADNGKLYSGFDSGFPECMLRLCRKADIITPNITEACLLTETDYDGRFADTEFANGLLEKLQKLVSAEIVLTGVCRDEKIGAAVLCDGNISFVFSEKQKESYHGTGDLFTSVLTGALMNGRGLCDAAGLAAEFTSLCIKTTAADKTEKRYGVNFEKCIPKLIEMM